LVGLATGRNAAPILLAWRLHNSGDALGLFDPTVMILRAASYLYIQGPPLPARNAGKKIPATHPQRSQHVIAGLVCAAEHAKWQGQAQLADFHFGICGLVAAHLEEWTVTSNGELVEGIPRHLPSALIQPTPTRPILTPIHNSNHDPGRQWRRPAVRRGT